MAEALSGPVFLLGVQGGFDGYEAGAEQWVVEVAVHGVGRELKFHALELRASSRVLSDALLDGAEVGIVVPEEAALHEICEGIPVGFVEVSERSFCVVLVDGGGGG